MVTITTLAGITYKTITIRTKTQLLVTKSSLIKPKMRTLEMIILQNSPKMTTIYNSKVETLTENGSLSSTRMPTSD